MLAKKLIESLAGSATAVYVEDVFSTHLYNGIGLGQDIVNGIQLGTGFTSFTDLGGPNFTYNEYNFGRYSAKDYAKSGIYLFTCGNDAGVGTPRFYYSNNSAVTWNSATITSSGSVIYACKFFAGRIFVATNISVFAASTGASSLSTTGIPPANGVGLKIANGKLFALHTINNTPSLSYSDNGINFVSGKGIDNVYGMLDIAYGGGYYYLLGVNTTTNASVAIFRSSDLSTWTTINTISGPESNARIAYGNNRLVVAGGAGGGSGKIYYSDDFGVSFTTVTGVGAQTSAIDHDGEKFFLGAGGYAYSTNAITWTPISVPNLGSGFVRYTDDSYIINQPENYPAGSRPKIATKSISVGKGGLIWTKNRTSAISNINVDTVRGGSNALVTNTTAANSDDSGFHVRSFLANGYSLQGAGTGSNTLDAKYVSWTFRKERKFFDVLTYTGTGVARTVSHNLGSTPGSIIIKRTDTSGNAWYVYHRSLGATKVIFLNQTDAAATVTSPWNDTAPTSTEFTVGPNNNNNASGGTFVAYLFAHDAGGFGPTGNDNIISCGSYTGTSGETSVNLGFEPQWLMIKAASPNVGNWMIFDSARGLTSKGSVDLYLASNLTAADNAGSEYLYPTATGFTLQAGYGEVNQNTNQYIYVAIRRPNKVPTVGTSVFKPIVRSGINTVQTTESFGFAPDIFFTQSRIGNVQTEWFDRLRGGGVKGLQTTTPNFEGNRPSSVQFNQRQNNIYIDVKTDISESGYTYIDYAFKRAPKFFDVVGYTGTGSTGRTVPHSLTVVPELIIVKNRLGDGVNSKGWAVNWLASPNRDDSLILNTAAAAPTSAKPDFFADTRPTSSVFTVGADATTNLNTWTYSAYLFATLAGVSKVGTYTGTATTLQIPCGFTNGARFVMIKRINGTGEWYYWDTVRGIIAGNDPYLLFSSTSAEVTNTDYIDQYALGFELSSTAPAALNASGGSYLFLAIA